MRTRLQIDGPTIVDMPERLEDMQRLLDQRGITSFVVRVPGDGSLRWCLVIEGAQKIGRWIIAGRFLIANWEGHRYILPIDEVLEDAIRAAAGRERLGAALTESTP